MKTHRNNLILVAIAIFSLVIAFPQTSYARRGSDDNTHRSGDEYHGRHSFGRHHDHLRHEGRYSHNGHGYYGNHGNRRFGHYIGYYDSYYNAYPYGAAVLSLPFGYINVAVGGANYYYSQGIFYHRIPGGFVVSEVPIGAIVPNIPDEYRIVVIDEDDYYFCNDLPPKKWTKRRDGFSIKTSSKKGGVQWEKTMARGDVLTGILS
jgi:hypothetical protein